MLRTPSTCGHLHPFGGAGGRRLKMRTRDLFSQKEKHNLELDKH